MWTEGGSASCDRGEHERCDGIAYVIDQDGHSRYVCDCYCHTVKRRVAPPATSRPAHGIEPGERR